LKIFESTSFNRNLSGKLTPSSNRLPSPAMIGVTTKRYQEPVGGVDFLRQGFKRSVNSSSTDGSPLEVAVLIFGGKNGVER
jgi:hypothetical protein